MKQKSRFIRNAAFLVAASFVLVLAACQSVPKGPLSVYNQMMHEMGYMKVYRVQTDVPAWLVVYADSKGAPGEVIGTAHIPAGQRYDVRVFVDAKKATEILFVKLHIDAGTPGVFEYPGPDEPVILDEKEVMTSFQNWKTRKRY